MANVVVIPLVVGLGVDRVFGHVMARPFDPLLTGATSEPRDGAIEDVAHQIRSPRPQHGDCQLSHGPGVGDVLL